MSCCKSCAGSSLSGVQSRPLVMRERTYRAMSGYVGAGADAEIELPAECARKGEVPVKPGDFSACAPPLLQSAAVFAGIAAVFYFFGRR